MEPGATCRKCEACKVGKYNVSLWIPGVIISFLSSSGSFSNKLCPDVVFAATPPYDGTLARYYSLPADLCYKLPDNLTLEEGAMVRIFEI